MKHYELMYLASMQVPETELDGIQTEVNGLILGLGGTITRTESIGRKKLAYPIAHERYGFYFLTEFDLEPNHLAELNRKLKLGKSINRYLIATKKPLSARKIMAQERARRRAQEAAKARATERPVEKPKAEQKIKLDELDKKLDELLDQDIID